MYGNPGYPPYGAPGPMPPMPPMPGYGPRPVLREKARGFGIDPHEYTRITQCAMDVYQRRLTPYSTHTANAIKQMLGGDWVVVCYPEVRAYDFAMTVVKGGDFMTFTLDNVLFQVCRLK